MSRRRFFASTITSGGTPVSPSSTYYVSEDGTGDGLSSANPMSIADLEALTLVDGYTINFKKGDTFELGDLDVTADNITFGTFDTGNDPIIIGSEDLSGATWTSETGGYYSTPLASAPKWVFINGEAARQGESDWIYVTSVPSSTTRGANTATLNAFNTVESLVGAKLRGKEFDFRYSYEHTITNYNTGTGVLTLNTANTGFAVNFGFRLYGQKQFATLEGDWWWDSVNNELWIKTASTPAGTDIRVCTKDYAFKLDQATGTTINGLEFTQFYRTAIDTYRASDTTIDSCYIHDIRTNGLWMYGNCTGITVSNSEIFRCGLNGIFLGAISFATFSNNEIHEIGDQLNYGWPLDAYWRKTGGDAIACADDQNETVKLPTDITVTGCNFYLLGYQGVAPYGDNWVIENTVIHDFSQRFEDGGGVHSFYRNDLGVGESTSNGLIQNCFIYNGLGNADGVNIVRASLVAGVYFDNGTNLWTVDNCTIHNNSFTGVLCNWNTEENTIINSTIYNNGGATGTQLYFEERPDGTSSPNFLNNYKNVVTDNIIICNEPGQVAIYSNSASDANYNPFTTGNCDNNYYVKPYNVAGTSLFRYKPVGAALDITFTAWKTRISDDAASVSKSFYLDQTNRPTGEDDIKIVSNITAVSVIHDVTDGYYTDVASADITELTIPAYSTRVALIKADYYYLLDSFTGTNGTSMAAKAPTTYGNNANVISGTHTINSGSMVTSSSGLVSWNVGSPNYDIYIQNNLNSTVPIMRMDMRLADNTASTSHRLILDFTGGNIRLREWNDNATVTNTWTAAYTLTTGVKNIRVRADGASIKIYVAEVLLIDVTTGVLTGNWVAIFGEAARETRFIAVYPLAEEWVSGITIPGSLTIGSEAEGTYSYIGSSTEENPPPTIDNAYIDAPNGMVEGETIDFIVEGHRVYNDGVAAPTEFTLYRANDRRQGSETSIYSGTATSYVLVAGDVGKYLRLEATPKQTGGANLTGEVFKSAYTDIVTT